MNIINSDLLSQLNKQLAEPVTEFPLDGKFHHFKNGKPNSNSSHIWACGFSWEFKGNTYQYVTAGDWRDGSKITVRSYDTDKISRSERKTAQEQIKRIEDETKRIREQSYKDCKDKWEPIFHDSSIETTRHEYLRFKKIDSNYRARIRNNTTLLIPIENPEHGFVGCQQIWKDKETGKYLKIFTKGIRIRGSFSKIEQFNINKSDLIYIAEGFATACSVYMATKKDTICCFNAGNIIPVIASIRAVNPQVKIIIAADDDHQNKKNPGKYYANQASKQFSNVVYRLPSFSNPDGLTDFNDLHVCESIDKVKEQLTIDTGDFVNIICLGHSQGNYYYVNTQTSEIFNLAPSAHVPSNYLAQATSKYWGQRFRFKTDKDGNPTSKPDWDYVTERLLKEQRDTGFFDHDNVRGYGAWLDKDRIIFNSGKTLYVYEKNKSGYSSFPITEHNLNTEYVYEANKSINFKPDQILSRDELDRIIECFGLASYKNANDYIYILGFIATAQIPGVCPWRSHEWLTGSRGSGKTTLLSWISTLCYNQSTIQDPTQAGLRQSIGYNALPVFIDETEPNNPEARRRLDQIMDLIRQSSSPNSSKIIRGTADGKAQSFLVSACFMLSSIQVSIKNAADISRFTVIEITKNSRENFSKMKQIASEFEDLSPKLLAYMLSEAHNVLANFNYIHDHILDEYPSLGAREADQIAILVAGFYALRHGGLISDSNPESVLNFTIIMAQLNINASDYVEDNREGDEDKCLDAILDARDMVSRHSIKYMISQLDDKNEGELGIILQDIGIKVLVSTPKYKDIFIQSNSNQLRKMLVDTEFQEYAKILRRSSALQNARKNLRIHGIVCRGIVIRIELDKSDFSTEINDDAPPF